jgi:hypothetical protein
MEGLQEASAPPAEHTCEGRLVDATISWRRLVLICYTCGTFWHTAMLEDSQNPSAAAMIRAADELYQEPQYKRMPRLRQAREEETERMVRLYERGRGCYRIGRKYGVSDTQIYDRLKRAGVQFRPQYKRLLPKIEFNNAFYTFRHTKGYYRKTTGDRSMLHWDIWRAHHGEIPDGYQIHHLDSDPTNNAVENLICVPPEEGTKIHHPLTEISVHHRCLYCGKELRRKRKKGRRGDEFWESPSELARRKYCDRRCHYAHRTGKPKGWIAQREEE